MYIYMSKRKPKLCRMKRLDVSQNSMSKRKPKLCRMKRLDVSQNSRFSFKRE